MGGLSYFGLNVREMSVFQRYKGAFHGSSPHVRGTHLE